MTTITTTISIGAIRTPGATRTTPATAARRSRSTDSIRLGHRLGETALNLAALGGLIALTLIGLAFFFNVTLIMFKTGSMSPTIPAGSLSVVREIPASDISVGDVVTVDRADDLPITHRVTSASAVQADGTRSITLKGDANELEDPAPYTVSTVRTVLVSVPGLARVVVWFSNPMVLGSITLGATSLVIWAFWPRDSAPRSARARHAAHSPVAE